MSCCDFLEVRVINLHGKTSYRARCEANNEKKLREIFSVLSLKFDIDVRKLMVENKVWFDL